MAKADRMYANPPKAERDDSGKLKVKKASKANAVQSGTDGMHEGEDNSEMPMAARHMMAHEKLHGKHMVEHAQHKGNDKSSLHERHQAELKSLHKVHEKEMKAHVTEGGKDEPTKTKPEMPKGEHKANENDAGEKASEKKK